MPFRGYYREVKRKLHIPRFEVGFTDSVSLDDNRYANCASKIYKMYICVCMSWEVLEVKL